jgi:hypothetical protein
VRAIADENSDGTCSLARPGVEIETAIRDDDTTNVVDLVLASNPCPE